jgi:tetratricopeptide (TPR) repeat protein
MRFGKVFLLGKIRDYDKFTEEIIKAIEYGETIQNKWLWTDSQPLDDPEKFMLSTVQAYTVQLFNVGESQNDHMRRITRTVLKYHPDNVENLSDLSITYIVDKRYPDALEALLKAEKIAPQDYIVLNNIAYCYAQQGNKADAIKYYEKVKQFGPGEEKQKAEQKIQELNN